MKRDPNCTDCGLHKHAETVCLLGAGPQPCDVMIIGEAPGREEDAIGKPFIGSSGTLLREGLSEAGIDPRTCFITNAVACRPPDNRTPKRGEIAACKRWLDYQLRLVQPKYVLLLGNVPLQAVLGLKGIRKHRGRPVAQAGVVYLPTYHPAYVKRDPRQHGKLMADITRFAQIIRFGGIPVEKGLNPTIIKTWRQVDYMIDKLVGIVSCDIETTGLYPWAPDAAVTSLGFGVRGEEFLLPVSHPDSPWRPADLEIILDKIDEAVNDCTLVFHNGKFDLLYLRVLYGIEWANGFDTMLAHYQLDENSLHNLEHLAQLYFGAPEWEIPLEEKTGHGPYDRLAKYHAADLFYTRKLYFELLQRLKLEPRVHKVFTTIMMPVANLFVDIEHHGCYVDVKRMAQVETHLLGVMADAQVRLKKWGEINWGSPKQVADLLYTKLGVPIVEKTAKGAPSTNESCLKRIDHPAVADLLRYRGAKQQHSFFIEGWKPYIVKSRIHPSFKLHGTVTGRLSCEHPNFQQVPRDPTIRSLITAPPGWVFIDADLSQIELRIVAELSKCPALVKAFRDGIDVHWLTGLSELQRGGGEKDRIIQTAKRLTGRLLNYGDAIDALLKAGPDAACDVDKTWKELRKKAKAVNFGYVFGMWWKKFKQYARDNYDLKLTDDEARESREAFFDTYPLENWHKRQQRYVREFGFIESLTGRKRRLPAAMIQFDTPERAEAWRQSINSPVQSFANELNLMVLLQCAKEFSSSYFRPVMTVHDQIGAEVKREKIGHVAKQMELIMRGPNLLREFDISLSVPIAGEVSIGAWGTGIKLEKWEKQNG